MARVRSTGSVGARLVGFALFLALVCGSSFGVRAGAWRGYLHLEGIPGEVTDADHQGWIAVSGFDEEAMADVSARSGKASLAPLRLGKALDRASPKLVLLCARGGKTASAEVELMREIEAGPPVRLLFIRLGQVVVTRVAVEAPAAETPREAIDLAGESVEMTYVEVDVRGEPVKEHELTWDLRKGTADYRSSTYGGPPGGGGVLLRRNLLINGGAEAGGGAADEESRSAPPGWTIDGTLTAVRYGDPFLGSPGDEFGVNCFAGGPDSGVSSGRQLVAVDALATSIDASNIKAVLSGWLGGKAGELDSAELSATFLGADGGSLAKMRIGPVTDKDRKGESGLEGKGAEAQVPPGTRSVQVVLTLTRSAGAYNNGYADNLSLELLEGKARPPELPVRVHRIKSGVPGVADVLQVSWPVGLENVVVESADELESGWNEEHPEVRLENGERVLELPLDSAQSHRFWRLRDVR